MGLCSDATYEKMISYLLYLYAVLNDLFGFDKPVCLARGFLFFGLISVFWMVFEIPLVVSFVLAFVAHWYVGGEKQVKVIYRTVGRDLR